MLTELLKVESLSDDNKGKLYYQKGSIQYKLLDEKEKAILSFYQAMHHFRITQNKEMQYRTLSYLGNSYRYLQHPNYALEYYREIRDLGYDNVKSKLFTEYNIAKSLRMLQSYDSAVVIHKQLLISFKENNMPKWEVNSMLELGLSYLESEDLSNSKLYYKGVLNFKEINDIGLSYIARANASLGFISFKEGEFLESEKHLLNSLEQFITLDDPFNLVLNYNSLGRLYFAMGRYDLSIANYEKSVALNPNSTDIEQLMEAYKSLIFLSEQNGDSGQMLFYSTKLIELTTPFVQQSEKLETLHNQHQAETTQYLIERFEMEETLRISQYQNAILIIVLLSAIFIGFGYFFFKRRQKSDSVYIELMKGRFRILILVCQKYGLDMRALEEEYDSKYPK